VFNESDHRFVHYPHASIAGEKDQIFFECENGAGHRSAYNMLPPGIGGYTSPAPLKEEAEAARRLLAEAGHPGGKGFPKITLSFAKGVDLPVVEMIQGVCPTNPNTGPSLPRWSALCHTPSISQGRTSFKADAVALAHRSDPMKCAIMCAIKSSPQNVQIPVSPPARRGTGRKAVCRVCYELLN
jgi:hypothetical protein